VGAAGGRRTARRRAPALALAAALPLLATAAGGAEPETPSATPPSAAEAAQNGRTYDNWTVSCEQSKPDAQNLCFIFQNLVLKEGGQRVMHIAIGYLPGTPEPVALFTLPLGISLPPGASLKVGDHEPERFPIERCEPTGCRAGMKLDDALVEQLKKNQEAVVTFHDASRKPISVPLSLRGFTAGLESLR
jgi:invasion protein IalB